MTSVYIKDQGAHIQRNGERLLVRKDGQLMQELPLQRVEQLVLMGNIQISTQAMASMLDRNIDVVFLSQAGKYRGRLKGIGSKNAMLRQTQYQQLTNPAVRLKLAQQLVGGKLHNQRVLLQRQQRRNNNLGQQADYSKALQGIAQMAKAAKVAKSLDSLRGFEGKAGTWYFGVFRLLLDNSWQFNGRKYYPAPDPFNALLSFGYSLLLKEVFAALEIVGLDPYLGIYHEVTHGRPSLALDLMEEWRPLLVDAMAFELVNKRQLTPDDFRRTKLRKRPIELTDIGLRTVLKAYEQRLTLQHYHPLANGQTSLRNCIGLQSRLFVRVLQGKAQHYTPFQVR